MDNFMDKVAQKLTSQDMIRANGAADAVEIENLETQVALFKDQMEKYDDCIQEMRKLNLKNIESAQGVQELAQQTSEKFGQTAAEISSASVSKIQQTSDLSIAGINQAVTEGLAKIAEIKENADHLEAITGTMSELQTKLEASLKSMEDFIHTDNVKVYRNVQASVKEELDKRTVEIRDAQEKSEKTCKIILPFAIITMIFSLANLGISVAKILGLF